MRAKIEVDSVLRGLLTSRRHQSETTVRSILRCKKMPTRRSGPHVFKFEGLTPKLSHHINVDTINQYAVDHEWHPVMFAVTLLLEPDDLVCRQPPEGLGWMPSNATAASGTKRQKSGSEQGIRGARRRFLPQGSAAFHERMLAICLQSDTPVTCFRSGPAGGRSPVRVPARQAAGESATSSPVSRTRSPSALAISHSRARLAVTYPFAS
jgi:hypothetical protein